MPLNESPAPATNIINFAGTRGAASELNYNVPLPGRVRGRRILRLDGLPVVPSDWKDEAKAATIDLKTQIGLIEKEDGTFEFDQAKATELFIRSARANGIRGDIVSDFETQLAVSAIKPEELAFKSPRTPANLGGRLPDLLPDDIIRKGSSTIVNAMIMQTNLDKFLGAVARDGKMRLPASNPDGSPNTNGKVPAATSDPALYLVETYAISSFLGNYGLGRTVKTFTLLPGEQMAIKMRTWRSSEQVRKAASTVFDSFDSDSSERFTAEVQQETVDKATKLNTLGWHAEAQADVSWGFGSAKASGGGSGEEQAERENFVRGVNNAATEHASRASSHRDTTITSSSEATDKTEDEEVTERTIRNVNLRRTLNFVFRELNQEYLTKIYLIELRLAYSNGMAGSWREVPVSAMRGLLESVFKVPQKAAEVASVLLDRMMFVWDKDDMPVRALERIAFDAAGNPIEPRNDPARVSGGYPPPTRDLVYRFKRGPLGAQGGAQAPASMTTPSAAEMLAARHSQHVVDGILLKENLIVLRTDAVVVEALLGQADALDEYAMTSQKADAEAKVIANEREALVNEGLAQVDNGAQRLKLYAALVRPDSPLKIELDNAQR